ncbi:Hsp20 family protein [Streptomyces flaveolus]|uniref:Hsp20 family protein n=1 Tax=Streptomyces flaveolus TaxID=67297 RepID=UPI0033EB11A7
MTRGPRRPAWRRPTTPTYEENVTAELTDGVPTVKVPKAEKAKPRRIEITS